MFSFHRTPYTGENDFAYGKNSPPWEYYVTDDIQALARCMVKLPWSPICWKDGRRAKKNFIKAVLFGLDFDEGMTLEEAIDIFRDSIHIIGTTKSHQKDKKGKGVCDRFRVVLRFDEAIYDAELFKHQVQTYAKKYGSDTNAKDAGRPFWPCREIISINNDGYTQEIFEMPAKNPVYERIALLDRKHKRMPSYAYETFHNPWAIGVRNARLNTSFYLIFQAGFTKEEAMELFLNSPMFKENRETGFLEQTKTTMESAWEAVRNGGVSEQG